MTNRNFEFQNTESLQPLIDEYDSIDVGGLFAALLESKIIIISFIVFALLIGGVKSFLDTPIYQTDALLQIQEPTSQLGALESVSGLFEAKTPVLAEIEIIRSRKILGAVVQNLELNLIAEPKYFPIIGRALARRFESTHNNEVAAAYFELIDYAWGGESILVDTFEISDEFVGKDFTLIAQDQGHFKLLLEEKLVLEGEVGKHTTASDSSVSLFVSALKARPNTQFIVKKQTSRTAFESLKHSFSVAEKVKNSGILEFSLESANPRLAMQTLNEIANIYVRQSVELKSAEAQKTLAFLEKQLPTLKDQLEAATSALNEFRTQKGSVDLDTETQSLLQGIVELNTQLTLLQQKRDEARQKFTEAHPSVIAIDKQIARLQEQLKKHDRNIEILPETQQVILRLSRDVKVNTELYTTLLNNAQTLRVAKEGTVGHVRIIDEAFLPVLPIKPKKTLIIGISFAIGLLLGIGTVLIRRALHRGIEDPDLIEKNLNIPVYSTVPHSNDQDKLNFNIEKNRKNRTKELLLLSLTNKDDIAIESLRSLRTTLHFAFLEAQNNIIMITGPSPNVGKSFVSTNLAVMLADAGKKILLIDADLRKGAINKSLGLDRSPGLSDIITEEQTIVDSIMTIPEANIDFMATGSIPPNPSELLLHERFGILLSRLSQQYDHIIIDSPPVLAVTDACIIGRMASVTLMVAKAGMHPMRELTQSVKRLSQAGVSLKGMVFNDVPQQNSKYGYGYSKYIYQYNYAKTKQ